MRVEGRDPQIFGGSWENRRGSQGRREILLGLYVIMHSKYFGKLESGHFLKRNRIICVVVAVNGNFYLSNKKKSSESFASNVFWEIAQEKSKFFINLPGKNRFFLIRIPRSPRFH